MPDPKKPTEKSEKVEKIEIGIGRVKPAEEKKPVEKPPEKPAIKPEKPEKIELTVDHDALKKLKLVAVAYSHVERSMFPSEDAYLAEVEVEERAQDVIKEIEKLGIAAKGYPGDQYLLTNLLVDKPDLVVNLVDTLKGKDSLQTSVPAALELANIPYTGSEMQGLVIGNDRHLVKQLLSAYEIPTPPFQYIRYAGTSVSESLGFPVIVKLNESGGSVGIDNKAVKETVKEAQRKVDDMISTYKVPVVVERFISGPEITVVVFDDRTRKHVFMGQKIFRTKPDGKHFFTSFESYDDEKAYRYKLVDEPTYSRLAKLAIRAFNGLRYRDYAKFDVRVDDETGTLFFTDCNPNTAFGPDRGLPFTEVVGLYGISFSEVLASLLSKYAKNITG